MKVKQKITYPDGRVEETEIDMPLRPSKAQITWVLIPSDEEPVSVKITEAGWKDNGMRTFHVLTEYGLYDETSYSYLNEEQLLEMYPEAKEYLQSRSKSEVIELLQKYSKEDWVQPWFEPDEEWANDHLNQPDKISWCRDEVIELIQKYAREAAGQPWFESDEEWVNKNV